MRRQARHRQQHHNKAEAFNAVSQSLIADPRAVPAAFSKEVPAASSRGLRAGQGKASSRAARGRSIQPGALREDLPGLAVPVDRAVVRDLARAQDLAVRARVDLAARGPEPGVLHQRERLRARNVPPRTARVAAVSSIPRRRKVR